jgi:hypothetical protein
MRRAWAILLVAAATAVALDVAELGARERPLLDRRTCVDEPSTHTLALDRSRRGDALYRFVYGTLLGFGTHVRSGFPHVDVGPVCTLGWKDPVAAIKVGPHIFLVTFDGARVAAVEPRSD